MIRVRVVVEGPTEESFVKDVLAPTLWSRRIFLVPTILGVPGQKGGRVNYARVKKDVLAVLKQDVSEYCSTMLDFYGLGRGFPGTPVPDSVSGRDKALNIESAMADDIAAEVPHLSPDARFLPYLQLHEFEGLLFSDPEAFADGIERPDLAQAFQQIREQFPTPEDINDDPNTSPSKRVSSLFRPYRKPIDGRLAARAVTVERMRKECPHFREWVVRLEALGG